LIRPPTNLSPLKAANLRNGSRVIILSSVFHGAVSKTSNVLDIFLMQLKLSICHPLTPSVTLAHSGGGDGDRGDGDGMMGCPATSKSTGNHCGETVLGFGEIKLVTIMTGLACLVHRSCVTGCAATPKLRVLS
jgi:hypothetical protein